MRLRLIYATTCAMEELYGVAVRFVFRTGVMRNVTAIALAWFDAIDALDLEEDDRE